MRPGMLVAMAALQALTWDGTPLEIGTSKQLFLDDYVVERTENVARRLHHPVRYAGNPVVAATSPWENPDAGSSSGAYVFGSAVIFDEGDRLFKMWYRSDHLIAPPRGSNARYESPPGGYSALYAISKDGLRWEKPDLGLAPYKGSTANNLLPAEPGTKGFIRRSMIVKDYEEPDSARRYKMLYMDELGPDNWGLRKAWSPDGIHWRMNAGAPVRFDRGELENLRANGELFGWDPRRRRFVLFTLSGNSAPADVDGR